MATLGSDIPLEIRSLLLKDDRHAKTVADIEQIALSYLNSGASAKSVTLYQYVLRLDPHNMDAAARLADAYLNLNQKNNAKMVLLNLAEEYFQKNNLSKTICYYQKILAFDKHNVMVRLLLGDVLVSSIRMNDAVKEFTLAADTLLANKEYSQAEKMLVGSIEKVKNPALIEKLVDCYKAQGKFEPAITLLTQLGDVVRRNIHLLKILIELYIKANQPEKAEILKKHIAKLQPEEKDYVMNLGAEFLKKGEFDKAFQTFQPAIEKACKEKNFDGAISLLELVITYNNLYFPAIRKLAAVYKLKGDKAQLIAFYDSIINQLKHKKMKKELIELLMEMTQIVDTPGPYEEELVRLCQEGMSDAERSVINANLKIVRDVMRNGHQQVAKNILEQLVKVYPGNVEIRLRLQHISQATQG